MPVRGKLVKTGLLVLRTIRHLVKIQSCLPHAKADRSWGQRNRLREGPLVCRGSDRKSPSISLQLPERHKGNQSWLLM